MEHITALEKEEALSPHHGRDADIATCDHAQSPDGDLAGQMCVEDAGAQAERGDDHAQVSSVAERLHLRMEEAYAQLAKESS